MTGGYGCIGSWVAKQLADAGQEVWIYDLKEDTHRLDLILEPEQRSSIHFVAGDVSNVEALRAAVESAGATHILHLAGLQTPTCRAKPVLGATVNVIGTLAAFEAALAHKDQVRRVVYASSAAVHGSVGADSPRSGRRRGPPWRLCRTTVRSRCATCFNAKVYWLDHGITSIGLRPGRSTGGTRFRHDQRANQGDQVGRGRAAYRISYGGKQDLQYVADVAATFVKACRCRAPQGRRLQPERSGRADRTIRDAGRGGLEARALVTHGDRRLPTRRSLMTSGFKSGLANSGVTLLGEGILETYLAALSACGTIAAWTYRICESTRLLRATSSDE